VDQQLATERLGRSIASAPHLKVYSARVSKLMIFQKEIRIAGGVENQAHLFKCIIRRQKILNSF
jgi:hypothetical protein